MSENQESSPDQAVDHIIAAVPAEQASDDAQEVSDYERRLRREVARYREQARNAHAERDAALANAHKEREIAVQMARDDARERIVRSEMKAHALRAGIVDLDALRLADLSAVKIGDDGEVHGADDAIMTLRTAKPYLFNEKQTGSTAVYQRTPQPALPQQVDARALSREAWQAERAKLLRNR